MQAERNDKQQKDNARAGQSLIEYALILVLVGIAFGFALAATGPVIGNVFSNTVYNLLGQTPIGEGRDIARAGDFWLTVTWVAENPLVERPLPTRTLAPPSSTPTPGSPPPPTPIVPTRTPVPTSTPAPTATPGDFGFEAPHIETVDEPEHWRIAGETFTGYADWNAEYYADGSSTNPSSDGALDYNGNSPSFTETVEGVSLDYTTSGWPPQSGWPSASPGDHFSTRFTREIYLDVQKSLRFTAYADDGVRVWVIPQGQNAATCSATGVSSGQPNSGTHFYGDNDSTYSTDCLLIDDWRDSGNAGGTVTRTIPAGVYTVEVDQYERGGGQKLSFKISQGTNPDDTAVDNGGNPVAGGVDCNWMQQDQGDDANSLDFMWDPYGNYDAFPRNMRCNLEFRGYVYVPGPADPAPMTRPEFVFWDAWDLGDSNKTAWLEVAEYIPDSTIEDAVDRDALVWHRIDLHNGAAANYNWTRHIIDLTNPLGDGSLNFTGKRVTFRFVFQNLNSNNRRRWYIDDIEFRDSTIRESRDFLPGTYLNLNNDGAEDDFITSGQWELTANNAVPDYDNPANPEGCCSWELNPDRAYTDFTVNSSSGDSYATDQVRVHYVEFNGWVDINDAYADDEGDTGDAFISFTQAYLVGRRTGLEVQYTTTPYGLGVANWQPIPGPDASNPVGRIRDVHYTSNNGGDQRTLTPTQISLAELANQGITRFRLRFAMLVHRDADKRGCPQGTCSGWWIDELYLGREGPPKFLDYPFIDSAEIGMDNWQISGQWYRVNPDGNPNNPLAHTGDYVFTDSPSGDYNSNTNTALTTIYAIDLFNDTPENLARTDRNAAGGNSGGAAVDPVMTFWHWRDLHRNDNFYVEWRRSNETDSDWKTLWTYIYRMNTRPGDTNQHSGQQHAWEYVELELAPILNTLSGDPSVKDDDDILIRFRLQADSNYTRDGVYVDDIRIEERETRVHKLWPSSESRDVDGSGSGATVSGTNSRFTADGDETNWFERWRMGGDWEAIDWEQRNGVRAFHESAQGQDVATARNYDTSQRNTRDDTYNILEIAYIIDLRATLVEEKPTLYFWSRYRTGNDDRISVQISQEVLGTQSDLDVDIGTRCGSPGIPQCYDQVRGWGPWLTTSDTDNWPWYRGEWKYTYTWERQQVDLTPYASPDSATPGKRIRIRFVYDALDNGDNRDGWYIDNVLIGPREDNAIRAISEGAFFDPARNLNNWVAEGLWGLSPELYRGSGGGPATLGTWNESFWDCRDCESLVGGSSSTRFARGADRFLDSDGSLLPAYETPVTRSVLNINYDIGRGSPDPDFFDVRDRFVGRWVLDTPVVGPTSGVTSGDYTFITISDDGVRMKYREIDASGNYVDSEPPSDSAAWNIIYNWTDHGRTADMGTATLEEGHRYRLIIEWYEKWSSAVLVVSTGGTSFSFTDSPKQGAGPAFDDIPAPPNSNSSLILKGTLDLTDTTHPILEYYTLYETYGTLRVEVSTDGGFNWTSSHLQDSYVEAGSGATITFDDPTYGGYWHRPARDWRLRRENLTYYAGEFVMLRFRFDHLGRNGFYEDRYTANDYYNGWWIVDIRVGE